MRRNNRRAETAIVPARLIRVAPLLEFQCWTAQARVWPCLDKASSVAFGVDCAEAQPAIRAERTKIAQLMREFICWCSGGQMSLNEHVSVGRGAAGLGSGGALLLRVGAERLDDRFGRCQQA